MMDRDVIMDLVRRERFARDTADWDGLEACYWPDARIRTTWFTGSATAFVAGSREMRHAGTMSKHEISPVRVVTADERALVESNGQILVRLSLHETECDLTSWTRFFSRVRRVDGVWRLASWDAIYVKDRIDPVNWTKPPAIDWRAAEACRPAYRFFHYTLTETGGHCNDDLPGEDQPDLLHDFYADAQRWLHETHG